MLPTSDPRYSRHQQPETILVVDDEAAVLDVACRALRRAGYHTLAASNADEADALFDAHARS
ncbi:MAG TPA: hypothetical protein QGF05_02725, partial [Dehalococcoidia bacterium]|nr:hypothetical protein [Dehalococcoidia bacterium]